MYGWWNVRTAIPANTACRVALRISSIFMRLCIVLCGCEPDVPFSRRYVPNFCTRIAVIRASFRNYIKTLTEQSIAVFLWTRIHLMATFFGAMVCKRTWKKQEGYWQVHVKPGCSRLLFSSIEIRCCIYIWIWCISSTRIEREPLRISSNNNSSRLSPPTIILVFLARNRL